MTASNGRTGTFASTDSGSRRISRRTVLAATGLGGVASLTGCLGSLSGGGSDRVKVGLALAQSGPLANTARGVLQGFKLRMEEQLDNEINGTPVEFMTADTKGEVSAGVTAVRNLLREERVDVIGGPMSSATALAAVSPIKQAMESRDLLWLNTTAANYKIVADHCLKHQFRVSRNTWHGGAAMAPHVYENVGEKVALAYLDYAGGQQVAQFFRQRFEELGGEIVGDFPVGFGVSDYSPFLQKIGNSEADATFAMFVGSNAINFVKDYADFGLKEETPLTGIGDMVFASLLNAQRDAAVGVKSNNYYSFHDDNPRNEEFRQRYMESFDEPPNSYSCAGYDTAQALELGVSAVGGFEIDGITKELAGAELDSPRGFFQFHPDSHDPIMEIDIREVVREDGDYRNNIIDKIDRADPPTWGCEIQE